MTAEERSEVRAHLNEMVNRINGDIARLMAEREVVFGQLAELRKAAQP